jgi:hypothetical protein
LLALGALLDIGALPRFLAGLDVRARLPLDGRRLPLGSPALLGLRTPRLAGIPSAAAAGVAPVHAPAATRLGGAP